MAPKSVVYENVGGFGHRDDHDELSAMDVLKNQLSPMYHVQEVVLDMNLWHSFARKRTLRAATGVSSCHCASHRNLHLHSLGPSDGRSERSCFVIPESRLVQPVEKTPGCSLCSCLLANASLSAMELGNTPDAQVHRKMWVYALRLGKYK